MKQNLYNKIYYVIDDMTNNVVPAHIIKQDDNYVTLESTNSNCRYTRQIGNGIYQTAEEAHANREPIAMPTEAELRMEESRYAFLSDEYEEF